MSPLAPMNLPSSLEGSCPDEVLGLLEDAVAAIRDAKEQCESGDLEQGEFWRQFAEHCDNLQNVAANHLNREAENAENGLRQPHHEGAGMTASDKILATISLPIGRLERATSQPVVFQLQPFNKWYPQIKKAIDQTNREIRDALPILKTGNSQRALAEPIDDETLASLGALLTMRTQGRVHLYALAAELQELLRRSA